MSRFRWLLVAALSMAAACGTAVENAGAPADDGNGGDNDAAASEDGSGHDAGETSAPRDAGKKRDAGPEDASTQLDAKSDGASDAGADAPSDDDAAIDDAGVLDAAIVDAAPDASGTTTANGTCKYYESPRSLSCPTGMACYCYDRNITFYSDAGATLETTTDGGSVTITGGTLPNNSVYYGAPPHDTVLLADAGGGTKSGMTYAYRVTVPAAGPMQIELRGDNGYVAEHYIKYSSADCGHGGNHLTCKFTAP